DAAHVTGFVPVHAPAWHLSVWVHASPSLHVVPFAAAGLEHCPVLVSHVPTVWHWSDAVQATGFEPAHVPFVHESVCVHALPSLHDVPFGAAGFEHCPVLVLHVPDVWHWSDAAHVTGLAPVHVPAWHVSLCVHALPSLHAAPSAFVGLEHCPVLESQLPTVWHWSAAAHVTGFVPVHVPAWHVSVCVHALPSVHAVPSAFAGLEH